MRDKKNRLETLKMLISSKELGSQENCSWKASNSRKPR